MDIVKKLRQHVESRGGPTLNGAWQMMLDAADEIEHLRKETHPKHGISNESTTDRTKPGWPKWPPYTSIRNE